MVERERGRPVEMWSLSATTGTNRKESCWRGGGGGGGWGGGGGGGVGGGRTPHPDPPQLIQMSSPNISFNLLFFSLE